MKHFSYELEALKKAIVRPFILFLITATALSVSGTHLLLSAEAYLLPSNVSLIVLGPVSAFTAPLMMVFLTAFLVTFPYLLYSLIHFLIPALTERERRVLHATILPSLVLFYLGCALAFFFIIPETFSLLYSFASPLGVVPFFSLDAFVSSVFLVTISVGILFLLPVGMSILTHIGVVSQEFWMKHWRGALLSVVILSAVITPDGSGVTMLFLSVPLAVLYGVGAMASKNAFPSDILSI